jgi:hypothetical protein
VNSRSDVNPQNETLPFICISRGYPQCIKLLNQLELGFTRAYTSIRFKHYQNRILIGALIHSKPGLNDCTKELLYILYDCPLLNIYNEACHNLLQAAGDKQRML